jgi:type IV pilus assembly protein PilA
MTHARRRFTSSDGFTLIELLVACAIIAILAAVAVVSMLRAKIAANEASAIASIRAINTAQGAYSTSAASGGYATSLTVLSTPCPGSTATFISPDLATDPGRKSGYNVALAPGSAGPGPNDCNGTATRTGYYLTAAPQATSTGTRAFASSNPNVIYVDNSGVPPTEAAMGPGGGGTVLQ